MSQPRMLMRRCLSDGVDTKSFEFNLALNNGEYDCSLQIVGNNVEMVSDRVLRINGSTVLFGNMIQVESKFGDRE